MKQFIYLAIAILMVSCSKDTEDFITPDECKQITFTMSGEFTFSDFDGARRTRAASLEADNKSMTDVWILDYMGDELIQQIHQTSSDEDFGEPTLSLQLGSHNIYFIASRGTTPTLNTTSKILSWATVSDTFWKNYAITVVATSNSSASVTLDRVVTKFKATITDAIAEGTTTFKLTPAIWYQGINYTTGAPAASQENTDISITCPASNIGQSNKSLSVFGFSSATEWTTNMTLKAYNNENTVLGEATLSNVPLKRNRVTEFSGPLFGTSGSTTMSLLTNWDDVSSGVW